MCWRSAGLLSNRDLCSLGGHAALDPPGKRIPKVALNHITLTTITIMSWQHSKCLMIDTVNQSGQLLGLSEDFFSSLEHQEDHQDKFTAVRRSVISFVEAVPQKSCDSGWTYDHSLVFNTITSEVGCHWPGGWEDERESEQLYYFVT